MPHELVTHTPDLPECGDALTTAQSCSPTRPYWSWNSSSKHFDSPLILCLNTPSLQPQILQSWQVSWAKVTSNLSWHLQTLVLHQHQVLPTSWGDQKMRIWLCSVGSSHPFRFINKQKCKQHQPELFMIRTVTWHLPLHLFLSQEVSLFLFASSTEEFASLICINVPNKVNIVLLTCQNEGSEDRTATPSLHRKYPLKLR